MPVLTEQGFEPTLPLNHARIGYDDHAGTYTATSARSDSPAVAAKSWQTFERWRPTASPATLTKTFDSTRRVDYIGIGAATLSVCDSVKFELLLDGEWREVDLAKGLGDKPTLSLNFAEQGFGIWEPIPDNEAVMILLTPRNGCGGVRVNVEFSGTAPSIGKLAAGEVLTMLRPFYQGHSPGLLAADVTRTPSVSQGGEWLGTTIIRQGRSTQMQWANLGAGWVRRNLRPLIEHAVRLPFFVAWNPLQFRDCLYAASEGAPQKPTNSGPRDLQSWALDVKAYSDGSEPVTTPLVDREYDEIVTHTRASVGTYFDETGTLRTAAVDEPRFSYDAVTGESLGLLVEGEATNNVEFSEPTALSELRFSENVAIVADPFLGFDGGVQFSADASVSQSAYVERAAGELYNLSFFVQMEDGAEPIIRRKDSFPWDFQIVLGDAIAPTSVVITKTPLGRGLWRVDAFDPAGSGSGGDSGVFKSTNENEKSFIVSGFQTTPQSQVSSYIKTTGTPATRAPDVVSVGEVGKWLVSRQWSILIKIDLFQQSGDFNRFLTIYNGVSVRPQIGLITGSECGVIYDSGTVSEVLRSNTPADEIKTVVVTFNNGLLTFTVNGEHFSASTSAVDIDYTQLTEMAVQSRGYRPTFENGLLKHLTTLPYALTEAEAIEASKL